MKKLRLLFVLSAIFSLVACSGTPSKPGEDTQSISGAENGGTTTSEQDLGGLKSDESRSGNVEVIGASGAVGADGKALDGESLTEIKSENSQEPLGKIYKPVVYFDYDQFSVSDENLDTVKHYANILLDNPEQNIKLIGHTDERGTPEYNLALGERRAKAVAQAFMLFGVANKRIEIISLGEEQPAVDGHNESAWSKNRRVEMKAQ